METARCEGNELETVEKLTIGQQVGGKAAKPKEIPMTD